MSDDPFEGIRRTEFPEPWEVVKAHRWQPGEDCEGRGTKKTFPRRVALAVGLAAFGVMLCVLTLVARSGAGVVGLAGGGMLLLAALSGWFLRLERYAGYCPRCESCLAPSGSWKPSHARWCDQCDYLCRPEELPAYTGEWHIDYAQLAEDSDYCHKWLVCMVGIALREKLDEITFEPTCDDYRIRARIADQWHELEAFGPSHRRMVAISRWIWGFDPNVETKEEGEILVSAYEESAIVRATFGYNDVGETLTFRFQHSSDPSAKRIPSDSGVLVG